MCCCCLQCWQLTFVSVREHQGICTDNNKETCAAGGVPSTRGGCPCVMMGPLRGSVHSHSPPVFERVPWCNCCMCLGAVCSFNLAFSWIVARLLVFALLVFCLIWMSWAGQFMSVLMDNSSEAHVLFHVLLRGSLCCVDLLALCSLRRLDNSTFCPGPSILARIPGQCGNTEAAPSSRPHSSVATAPAESMAEHLNCIAALYD